MQKFVLAVLCVFFLVSAAVANVTITSPANNSTVSGSVNFAASASSPSCSQGVASMGIYIGNSLDYVVNGNSLSTTLSLSSGSYNATVTEWNNCGSSSSSGVSFTVSASSGVYVTSPAKNSTVGSPVNFVASATTTCSKGVATMGIYTGNTLAYVGNGASLNTSLALSSGSQSVTITEWDNCGGASSSPVSFTVSGSGGGGGGGETNSFTEVQRTTGWQNYGQGPPNYVDCNPCSDFSFSMTYGISNPSLSGNATEYSISGSEAYWDALFTNHLIGPFSTEGLPDPNQTLVPQYHNFTYDVYFYSGHLGLSQALEFDINQFFNGNGYVFGHQCVIEDNTWDIWNAAKHTWVNTGISCNPISYSWNHLTIQVKRTSDNQLLYESITLNGVTNNVNQYYNPGSYPGWYGLTINYQQDGNYEESPYNVFLDELTFSYD
jgi:hypothetical protein